MRMSFLKVVGFSMVILFLFSCISMYVARLSGTTGGEVVGGIDPETGEKLFWGDGQCSTCHKIGSQGSTTRGPDLDGFFTRAEKRAKEKGMSSPTEYIVESMVDPGAYLVEGYGNIMPKVFEPPILLDRDKILATVVYLQTLGGDVDVNEVLKFKDKIPSPSKKKVKPWESPVAAGPEVGEQVFFSPTHQASCFKCHVVKGQGKQIGPDLSTIGAIQTPQYIIDSILDPSKEIVKGYETVLILTKDGIPYDGVIKSQNESEIILARNVGGEIEELAISKDDIEEMKKQELSMMPGNDSEILSVKEFYGLVNYLLTLK